LYLVDLDVDNEDADLWRPLRRGDVPDDAGADDAEQKHRDKRKRAKVISVPKCVLLADAVREYTESKATEGVWVDGLCDLTIVGKPSAIINTGQSSNILLSVTDLGVQDTNVFAGPVQQLPNVCRRPLLLFSRPRFAMMVVYNGSSVPAGISIESRRCCATEVQTRRSPSSTMLRYHLLT
jgi:hypothetical protein